jgi:hypothetical protein
MADNIRDITSEIIEQINNYTYRVSGNSDIKQSYPPYYTIPKEDPVLSGENRARLYFRLTSDADKSRLLEMDNSDLYKSAVNAFLSNGGFFDFIATSISISHREKTQVSPLFGDDYLVLYFGREPPTILISGILYNSVNAEWWDQFVLVYKNAMRGSKLGTFKKGVYLSYYDYRVYFSVMSFDERITSELQTTVPFSITGVVHNIKVVTQKVKYVATRDDAINILGEDILSKSGSRYIRKGKLITVQSDAEEVTSAIDKPSSDINREIEKTIKKMEEIDKKEGESKIKKIEEEFGNVSL